MIFKKKIRVNKGPFFTLRVLDAGSLNLN